MYKFHLYPAIDIKNGKCVRLLYGNFETETVYETDVLKQVEFFINKRCKWIHIVDLNSALSLGNNEEIILNIVKNFNKQIYIQLGGGIRSYDKIKYWIDKGISRVIVGSLAYENPETLQIAADAIGREIQTSDYFARDNKDEVLTSDPRVISKSFDPDLINSENNSDVIELSDDHIIVLRVDEHKESTIKPLDEVADEVIARIRIDLAKNKVKTVGSLIADELKSGVDPDMLNSYSDIEWISIEKVKRDDVSVNRAVLRAIFESEKPIDNKPVIATKLLGSGDYAVIIISNSHEEISEIDEELEASTDLKLRRVYGTNEWQYLLRDTRENAKINIFKDNI